MDKQKQLEMLEDLEDIYCRHVSEAVEELRSGKEDLHCGNNAEYMKCLLSGWYKAAIIAAMKEAALDEGSRQRRAPMGRSMYDEGQGDGGMRAGENYGARMHNPRTGRYMDGDPAQATREDMQEKINRIPDRQTRMDMQRMLDRMGEMN